jgi:hypothetical protein
MTVLTESEKAAARALVQNQIDALLEAAYAIYAAGKASSVPVVVPVPEPEVPAPGAVSRPFQTMVWEAQGKTLTVNTDPLIVKDHVIMQLGNGQSVNVIGVTASKLSGRSDLTIDQTVKGADVAYKLATVKDRYPASTAPSAPPATVEPVPETPPVETPAPTPTPSPISTAVRGVIGINLGMGAGGDSVLPGIHGRHYAYSDDGEIGRAAGHGFLRYRGGGLWERFIDASGKLITGAGSSLEEFKRYCRTAGRMGAKVLAESFHNYGGYSKTNTSDNRIKVGAKGGKTPLQFAQEWNLILTNLKADAEVWAAIYGVDTMNEPESMGVDVVFAMHQAFLDVNGVLMGDKMCVFEGINFSSTVDWVKNNDIFKNLKHPVDNKYIEFSGHLYLDQGSSGFYSTDSVSDSDAKAGMTTANIGVKRIAAFAGWLKKYGFKGSIGEHIVTGNLTGLLAGSAAMLKFCIDNGIDVYIFGMSSWFGDNHHNIELPINQPTLAMVKEAIQYAKAA